MYFYKGNAYYCVISYIISQISLWLINTNKMKSHGLYLKEVTVHILKAQKQNMSIFSKRPDRI